MTVDGYVIDHKNGLERTRKSIKVDSIMILTNFVVGEILSAVLLQTLLQLHPGVVLF